MVSSTKPSKPFILPVIPENIPTELRAESDWVCWRMEWREGADGKEGKWTKVPYDARTGSHAKSNTPSTWSPFDVALAAYQNPANKYDGIGFMLADSRPKSGGLIGVDLDHVVDSSSHTFRDWEETQRGKNWMPTIPPPMQVVDCLDSYSEFSPSGTGVRIFIKGRLWDKGRKQGALEVYDCGRFLTVTGHRIDGKPAIINKAPHSTLKAIYTYFFNEIEEAKKKASPSRRTPPTYTSSESGKGGPSVENVTRLARRFNSKFGPLFDGNIAGYPSQSEADAALCCMAAFYAGPAGHSLVDGVFRQSALMRDKWDHSHASDGTTYGEMTISSAIAKCSDFFDWDKPGQIIPDSDDPPPNEAIDDPHRLARVNLERYHNLTAGGKIHYWRDEWYIYKTNKYRKIPAKELESKIAWAIKEEFNRANIEAQKLWEEKRKEAAKSDTKFTEERPEARKVTKSLVGNVMQATASMSIISGDIELNSELPTKTPRNWIAMQNGIVDVDAFLDDRDASEVLKPHTSGWFSVTCLPYEFNPRATCPRWLAFLDRCMGGDKALIAILQEWAGYLLLPDTGQQKFLVNEGEGGNGKSVYMSAIEAMLGVDNCSHVSLEKFAGQFDLTETLGKLANICGDMGEIDKIGEGHLKSFTGGDRMLFNRKNLSGINCAPTARLMFNTNNRPRFSDKSSGIWRRILLIPWNVTITKSERVLRMDQIAWWQESGELPGIFIWAIKGLARLRMQKAFTFSEVVDEAVNSYRKEVNPAREFLLEFCEAADKNAVPCKMLYTIYRKWTEENGNQPMAATVFGREVHRAFPEARRTRYSVDDRHWRYENLRITTDKICGIDTDQYTLF
jgi:putative DNA primase/helicase